MGTRCISVDFRRVSPVCARVRLIFKLEKKFPSIDDRGQTDRVTVLANAHRKPLTFDLNL